MTENKTKKLQTLYRIIFSIFTAVVGLLLIIQLWGIYRSAPTHAFSRASIAKAVGEISVTLWLWIVCLFLNIVISRLYPQEPVKLKGGADTALLLAAMRKRFKENGKGVAGVKKQRLLRLVTRLVGGVLILFTSVWALSYLFDKDYVVKRSLAFFSSHNGIADRALSMLPWLAAAILVGIACAYVIEYTNRKELALLKAAFAEEFRLKKQGNTDGKSLLLDKGEEACDNSLQAKWARFYQSKSKQFTIALWALRGALFVSAIVLIILGVEWGGMDLILGKAREVCQQCIGLG
ncbi:MAG: hypothetical protein IJX30_03085 [Clostridia bacterium]|nr:hypothetical protein [Clostridia bacterium]